MKRHAALILLWPLAVCAQDHDLPDGLYAEISTPKGVVTCELEPAGAPLTVASFVGLAEGSLGPSPRKPFFDGLTFHRVVPNFVVQGGDPLGTGEGGPGYSFPDEFAPGPGHDSAGVLSMANEGPDTNGSQFFITLGPAERLNYLHSVFGRTVRGLDVLLKIAQGDAMRVRIIRSGAQARAFRADETAFAELLARARKYGGEREPGPNAHFDDPDKLLPSDPPRSINFNFKLCNVERATGVRIFARLYEKFTPAPGADTPDSFAERLARTLGLDQKGVLAVYFSDSDSWCIKVCPSLAGRYTGLPGEPRDLMGNGSLNRATKALLLESRKRGDRYTAQLKMILANNLQIPGQKIKISTDAILDELIGKLTI